MGWMLFRLVLALLLIAAVLIFATRVAKKRGLGGGALIDVLGRQPLSRGGSVSVVKVADRVFLLGTTEGQITLIAEMDEQAVHEAMAPMVDVADAETGVPGSVPVRRPVRSSGGALSGSVFDRAQWAAFVDTLRERTVRRG